MQLHYMEGYADYELAGNCTMRELKKTINFVFCHAYPETFEVGHVGLPFEVLLHLITSALEKNNNNANARC